MNEQRRAILSLRHISKTFPGVKALDDVNMDLYDHEVLGICGENGAGKSTLLKVFSGIYKADEGEIIYGGKPCQFKTPSEGIRAGISIIHQELSYVNDLSVAENIFQGRLPLRHGLVNWKKLYADAQQLLDEYNIPIDAKKAMRHLAMAEKQLVEIIKSISINAKIVVMDEPTSSLGLHDVQKLMSIVRDVSRKGASFIFISHRLEELFEICDRLVVLRDGKTVGEFQQDEFEHLAVVSKMVGRTVTQLYPKEHIDLGEVLFEVRNLSSEVLDDVSLTIRAGEIVGLYGMAGAGQDEIMDTVFGLAKDYKGEVRLEGRPLHIRSPRDAIENHIAYVTAERKRNGLIIMHSVQQNISLADLRNLLSNGFLNHDKEQRIGDEWIQKLDIKTSSRDTEVGTLSGGNQQKVVMAKWFQKSPKVLLLNEPTRGVDVGAKHEIFRIVQDLCKQGMAVLMISSDMLEMLSMADTIHAVCEGRITATFDHENVTQVKLMMAAIDKLEEDLQ